MNITISVSATVSEGTDLGELRQRVEDQLRKISNPVREDKGITTVKDTEIRFTYQGVTKIRFTYQGVTTQHLNFGENDGSTHTWK